MNKKLITLLLSTLFCYGGFVFASPHLCIALLNQSNDTVEFDSVSSPGYTYSVAPNTKAILSRDHMVGSCDPYNHYCTVTAKSKEGFEIIKLVPPGSLIYYKPFHYFLDKKAKIRCD